MAVYKDGDKWRVIYRYTNYKGERKQTQTAVGEIRAVGYIIQPTISFVVKYRNKNKNST